MKKHLVYTGLFGFLYGVYKYIQGRSPVVLAYMVTPPATFVSMFLMCGLPVVIVCNIFTLPRLCKAHGPKGALPLVLSIVMFLLCSFAFEVGFSERMKEIEKRIPEYQVAVDAAIGEILRSGDKEKLRQLGENGAWVAREQKEDGLGYAVIVSRTSGGVVTAWFPQSVTINSHHSMILYRSDGDAKAALRTRDHVQQKIADNWWAVAD